MLNELDERINKALIFLSNAKDCTATAHEIEPDQNSFSNINIVKFLIELDLAVPVQVLHLSPDVCRISKKGIDIVKNGGWLKHLEREKFKSDKADRKLGYDLRISRIKANTFIPVMVLGVFGGIYSIIKVVVLVLGISTTEKIQESKSQTELVKPNKKSETEYPQLSDSLHSPNHQKTDDVLYIDQLKQGQKKE
jgi:hypothetical protein